MLDVLFTLNILLALVTIGSYQHKSTDGFLSVSNRIAHLHHASAGPQCGFHKSCTLGGHKGATPLAKSLRPSVRRGRKLRCRIYRLFDSDDHKFIVVTKGAGRSSEVAARFTLDAMPGRQMAIDADLAAGVIDREAKERRLLVSQESDFYGTMDGAAKYVRGDAIAGLLILLINLIGGVTIGLPQYDLSFDQAARAYTFTIGDGLVAQIPALIISLATALIVARFYQPISSRTGCHQLAN